MGSQKESRNGSMGTHDMMSVEGGTLNVSCSAQILWKEIIS